jgi:hypothetical protein
MSDNYRKVGGRGMRGRREREGRRGERRDKKGGGRGKVREMGGEMTGRREV